MLFQFSTHLIRGQGENKVKKMRVVYKAGQNEKYK